MSFLLRVHHKILEKDNNSRLLDRYTIFNNSIFRKKIKYLFIGLNPSASNDEFTDKTNLWIINWIVKKDKSGGYYLTNLYTNISPISSTKKTKNKKINLIINKYKKLEICVFYGANEAKSGVELSNETKAIFEKAKKEHRLFMTCDGEKFHHISMASSNIKIDECKNLSDIGIN